MVYAVYYQWSSRRKWGLAAQFRSRLRAEELIADMVAGAIRRGFNRRLSNLGELAIMRLDLQVPYGKAPKLLTEAEAKHRLGPVPPEEFAARWLAAGTT